MTQVPLKVSCNICACVFVASKTTVNYLNGLLCTPSYRITILTTEQRGVRQTTNVLLLRQIQRSLDGGQKFMLIYTIHYLFKN